MTKRQKQKQVAKEVPVYSKKSTLSLSVKDNTKKVETEKKGSIDIPVIVQSKPIGLDGVESYDGVVYNTCIKELQGDEGCKTFEKMSLNPTIAAVYNFFEMMINRTTFTFEAPDFDDRNLYSENHFDNKPYSREDIENSVKFLTYCKDNMDNMTWRNFLSGARTFQVHGYSIVEKNWAVVKNGKFAGKRKWSSLSPRPQNLVDKWKWKDSNPEILAAVEQKWYYIDSERYKNANELDNTRTIPRSKFMLFRHEPKNNSPEGTSPLISVYSTWKYLELIKEAQASGIIKDTGIAKIGYPAEKLEEAAINPNGKEAKALQLLQDNAFNAGYDNIIIVPLHYDETSKKPLYEFSIEGGISGSSDYDVLDTIKHCEQNILNTYSAGVLVLGQEGAGSYNLSDNASNLLGYRLESELNTIVDQINNDLIPQTLAINGWLFEDEDMPKIIYSDISPRNLDEIGKYLNRVKDLIPKTTEMTRQIQEIAGLKPTNFEKDTVAPEDFFPDRKSNASGDGEGSSGTGDTQNGGAGSDTNSENAS